MPPATDWKEIIPEGEPARLERHAENLLQLQRRRAGGHKALRGLHAKGNAGLEAELTVLSDLPEPLRVGLFAAPATYRSYVRFSNGSGLIQHDKTGDIRGVALKVVGIEGKKIIPGMEDAKTQDFLLIRSPSTPFRNADEFVGFVLAAESRALLLPRAVKLFGFGNTLRLLRRLTQGLGAPTMSLATTRYYSALPIRYGVFAAKYALRPHGAATAASGAKKASANHLGEELAATLREGPVTYDFQVQLYTDEARTPIEDASVEWKEEDAPFVTVARLTLLEQDVSSARGRRLTELTEGFSFDPWHALTELRPLGNMMRARNSAYRLSTKERGAAAEPDGTESLE